MTKKPQKLHWENYYESDLVSICVLNSVCVAGVGMRIAGFLTLFSRSSHLTQETALMLRVLLWAFFYVTFLVTVLHRDTCNAKTFKTYKPLTRSEVI